MMRMRPKKANYCNVSWVLLAIAVIVALTGCALLVWGFVLDPQGEIHRSVLIAFAEALIYVGCTPWAIFYLNHRKSKDKE